MDAAAELLRDDDSPPPSGVRRRVAGEVAPELTPAPAPETSGALETSDALETSGAPEVEGERHRQVLAEVATEVFFDVYALVRTLTPLQGAWFRLGKGQVGGAALTVATWQGELRRRPAKKVLRERWPELVPGCRALGCLVRVMVDTLVPARG